jgi:hypothetical protein
VVGSGGLKLTAGEPLRRKTVAISVSDSGDMPGLGLAEEHLRDAMAEIARHLLAMGAGLAYGGDLRTYGFSEFLFELVSRHRPNANVPGVSSYLAWPVHRTKSADELRDLARKLDGIAALHCLDLQGNEIPLEALARSPGKVKSNKDWSEGLTAMRTVLTGVSDACVVLGGRVTRFKGRMPGIAEEALSTLKVGRPLYVLGGFGGCARDIAEDLGFLPKRASSEISWPGRGEFQKYGRVSLQNGLEASENEILAKTVHVDEAVALMLRGLLRVLLRPVLTRRHEPKETSTATKADFTPDEWKLLLQSPLIAGVAISAADPSGLIGMRRESMASARALIQAKTDPNADALVKAVASEFETSEGLGLAQDGVETAISGAKAPAEIVSKAVDALKAASVLLDAKGGLDAAPFKTWLAGVAKSVAEAAPEGGFLGLGGTKVSETEKATVAQIAAALGVPVPAV